MISWLVRMEWRDIPRFRRHADGAHARRSAGARQGAAERV